MALNEKQLELKLCPIGLELLEEQNPVEASRSGSNTVFHYCDPTNSRASYAGCLHTLEAIVEGRGHLRPDCEEAVRNGTCPAVAMRKSELMANRALFYVDYKELMRRRGVEIAEREPVVYYGRSRRAPRPMPTTVSKVETSIRVKAPVEAPVEIETNIMEKILKKKVKDENSD